MNLSLEAHVQVVPDDVCDHEIKAKDYNSNLIWGFYITNFPLLLLISALIHLKPFLVNPQVYIFGLYCIYAMLARRLCGGEMLIYW